MTGWILVIIGVVLLVAGVAAFAAWFIKNKLKGSICCCAREKGGGCQEHITGLLHNTLKTGLTGQIMGHCCGHHDTISSNTFKDASKYPPSYDSIYASDSNSNKNVFCSCLDHGSYSSCRIFSCCDR